MAIKAPTQFDRYHYPQVVANAEHVLRGDSLFLDESKFVADSYGVKLIAGGLVLAVAGGKYVPYNSGAAYGTGSDTAVGVLETVVDATNGDPVIAPVVHGELIEENAYVFGVALGTDIPAAVKSALPGVHWK